MSDYYLSTDFGDKVLNNYFDVTTWLALHAEDPTTAGSTADEFSGGDYARQAVTWTAASSKSTANVLALAFHNLSAGTVKWFGIWDAATASNLMFAVKLSPSITILESGSLVITAGDIVLTL